VTLFRKPTVSGLSILLKARRRTIANAVRLLWRQSLLKIFIIVTFTICFIGGVFFGFYKGFTFIENQFGGDAHMVLEPFFSLFFASLGVMLIFSNAVILYGALMRTRETANLITLPLKARDIFLYRFIEATVFSSWGFVVLAIPMLLAYSIVTKVHWSFYLGSAAVILPFVIIPAGLAALIVLFLANYGPKAPKKILLYGIILLVIFGVLLVVDYMNIEKHNQVFTESWHRAVVKRLDFAQNELWPSYWLSKAMFFLSTGNVREGAFYIGLLVSNALMVAYLAIVFAHHRFLKAYSASHAGRRRRSFRGDIAFKRFVDIFFFYLPKETRLMVVKDFKTFRRDPAQWTQFLIFFGLLAVYFVNIRKLRYHAFSQDFRSFISLLNMGTTSLVLASFTGRFVFPQVSLESTRFWVIGLAPIDRGKILAAKFAFSFVGTAIISIPLIFISDYMLKAPPPIMALHAGTVTLISLGLAGISVGFGAIFPSLREENPSKIVSGFGGTINFMTSIIYIAFMVFLCGVPSQLYFTSETFRKFGSAWVLPSTLIGLALTAVMATTPYLIGLKKFRKMEV